MEHIGLILGIVEQLEPSIGTVEASLCSGTTILRVDMSKTPIRISQPNIQKIVFYAGLKSLFPLNKNCVEMF